VVTLTIDGQAVSAREDESIIEVARENRIPIPSLCHLEGLSVWGGCRPCMVEIAGSNRLVAACATRVAGGMDISTCTDKLHRYRRTIVELLFAERNHVCSVCVSNGHCELVKQGTSVGEMTKDLHFLPYLSRRRQHT
jgi:bidirectional [NiFe] hydrogenase diaphorase subunit